MSKTFRQYPQIVIHPPDESITTSMPDINTNLDDYEIVINNVSDKNVSCPDLRDENLYEDVVNFSKLSKDSTKDLLSKPPLTRAYSDGVQLSINKRKQSRKRKKKNKRDETPSDMLKKNWKIKHSTSMQNLKSQITASNDGSFNNYHTVHGSLAPCKFFAFDRNSCTTNSEVIYKCCCGRRFCEAVVPIQQYLETYFIQETVREK